MSIDPADIHLDREHQRKLAELAEKTGRPWADVLSEALSEYRQTHPAENNGCSEESFYDVASRLGLIGCIKGCPRDLSANPRHMEGFGNSDTRTSAG